MVTSVESGHHGIMLVPRAKGPWFEPDPPKIAI